MFAARGAWICCADESGLNLIPPVRTTWALCGQTPGPAPPLPTRLETLNGQGLEIMVTRVRWL
ncbi:hypothetical protein GCM10010399_66000 [Dactylosporangium fulvum]